jgi:hypothetical protein
VKGDGRCKEVNKENKTYEKWQGRAQCTRDTRHTFTSYRESVLTKEAGGFAFAAYGRKRPFAEENGANPSPRRVLDPQPKFDTRKTPIEKQNQR